MLTKLNRLQDLLRNLAYLPRIAALTAHNAKRLDELATGSAAPDHDYDLFPLPTPGAHRALLHNLEAMKANWPLNRTPTLDMPVNEDVPVPDVSNRRRIQGPAADEYPEPERFIAGGFSDMRAVINIAEVFGAKLDDETVTMDWGVGCSRMARHLPKCLHDRLIGADVDPINIEWSREHMPFGRFEVLDPYGGFELADNSVDFIYSHSVLTHLREKDQDNWLRELNRVCRGLMVLSIHGMYSVAMSDWGHDGNLYTYWLEHGFNTAPTPLPDIADVTDKDYYTGVAQTPDYIRTHWAQFVEVVEIIPGGFGMQHDAVVCRPKTYH